MPAKVTWSKEVGDLANLFPGANFADILNRLWMNGAKVADLQKALSTQQGVADDPQTVIKRLLDLKIVTADQIKGAVNSFVPENARNSPWPFHPETQGTNGFHTALFQDDARKYYPQAPQPTVPITPPSGATGTTTKNVTVPAGPKPEKAPVTPAEVEKYEKEHYGSMLWVKAVPSLNDLIQRAAKGQYTPDRFLAELHQTDWWKQNDDTMRKFAQDGAEDPLTQKKNITKSANLLKLSAQGLGFNLSDDDLYQLASDQMKFGWDETQTKQALIGKAQYDPNQQGQLGAWETQAKGLGKQYLINMTDEESWDWAKKLATGAATEANMTESLAARAKGAYPSIADYIESGGVPKNYFAQHLQTAASLLEMAPDEIDLTDPKYSDIIGHADDKGNIRPMTVYETSKFIKSKDEYWKTGNANNEVASLVNTLGQSFGKVGM